MSRLTIDVTEQQHQALKAMAALEGKTIKQYVLERVLPEGTPAEDQALAELKDLLAKRVAEADRGQLADESITALANQLLSRSSGA